MQMKKTVHDESATEISKALLPDGCIAIVELSDEELADIVAGAGYAAKIVGEPETATGGVLYRRAHRRYRRRAAVRRLQERHMMSDGQ